MIPFSRPIIGMVAIIALGTVRGSTEIYGHSLVCWVFNQTETLASEICNQNNWITLQTKFMNQTRRILKKIKIKMKSKIQTILVRFCSVDNFLIKFLNGPKIICK